MATKYRYKATTDEGKKVSGLIEASSDSEVYSKLHSQGLFMMSCQIEKDKNSGGRKMKPKVLCEFCRQLGTLLAAGVSLVRAMNIIAEDETTLKVHRDLYLRIIASLRQGTTLSDAMEEQGAVFPTLLINMMRSAEASGGLDKVCLRMADHFDKEYKLNGKVKGAMTYPAILGVMVVAVIIILFSFVLPQFSDLFSTMEQLPAITSFMMNVSNAMTEHWLLIIAVAIAVIFFISIIVRIPAVHYLIDKVKIKMPVFGKLLKVLYTARFARTLSSLYAAGLPIVACLQIARNTIGNLYIEGQFDALISKIRTGENLSTAVSEVDGFTRKLSSNIMIGEETGKLDKMLDSVSDTLDYEAELSINQMVSMIEPLMIVVMAIVVLIVIASVMLPLVGSYEAIEQSATN